MGKRVYHKISKYQPSLSQGRFAFSAPRGFSLAHEHPSERLIAKTLLAALVAFSLLYLYFITATVLNVMARKDALGGISRIQGSIGALEQEYFALSQSVDPGEAPELGLSPVSDTDYVYRLGNLSGEATAVLLQ